MSKSLLRSVCEAFLIYFVFQIVNQNVPAQVSFVLFVVIPLGFLVFLVGGFLLKCLWKWWIRPETEEERSRSLGGFWIRLIKHLISGRKSDNDSTQ